MRTTPNNNSGQLIILMGIILAISVFLISSIPTKLAGLNTAVSTQRSTFTLPEYLHISEVFGIALQNNFADIKKVDSDTHHVVYKPSDIVSVGYLRNAFDVTKSEFQKLLLQHDIIFNAYLNEYLDSRQFQYLSDEGHVYHVLVILYFYDGPAHSITQDVVYSVVSKERTT